MIEAFEVRREQFFNALKAIETLAEGTINVYGLPEGHGLDRRNDMSQAAWNNIGSGPGRPERHSQSRRPTRPRTSDSP